MPATPPSPPKPITSTTLSLDNASGFDRSIHVSSCAVGGSYFQVRGELQDRRVDYNDENISHIVHHMIIRLLIRLEDGQITDAEFALPKMAINDACEQLPNNADKLIGLTITDNFLFRINRLYAGSRSCFHIHSLLSAMTPTFSQARTWNYDFRDWNDNTPAKATPATLEALQEQLANSCHMWKRQTGFFPKAFSEHKYAPLLQITSPNLLARWKLYSQDNDNTLDDKPNHLNNDTSE